MSTSARSEQQVSYAYCNRRGVIDFGSRVPRGNLELAHGDENVLREIVEAQARHSRTQPVLLLVPGVPEANSDKEAEYAARVFANRLRAHLANGQSPVPPPGQS